MQEFQWRNWRILKSQLNAFSCEENLWPLSPHVWHLKPKTFTWNTKFNLRNPWTIPTLITGLGQKGGVVGYCGTKRGWGLQWCLRGWLISTPGKWMWNEAITCLRSIWLDATCSHFDSIGLLLVSFFFWSLRKRTKIVENREKNRAHHIRSLLGFLDSLDLFWFLQIIPFLAHPKSLQLRNAIANLDLEQPFKVWETPSGRRVGSKKGWKRWLFLG